MSKIAFGGQILHERLEPVKVLADQLAIQHPSQQRQFKAIIESIQLAYPAFSNLMSQLAPGLLDQRWSSVLVDVRSAELPARALRLITERLAKEHGTVTLPFHRVAAGQRISRRAIASQLALLEEGDRPLFFSEYFSDGNGVKNFAGAAALRGYLGFDVAVITTDPGRDYSFMVQSNFQPASNIPPPELYVGVNTQRDEQFYCALFKELSGLSIQHTPDTATVHQRPVDPNLHAIMEASLKCMADVLYEQHFSRP